MAIWRRRALLPCRRRPPITRGVHCTSSVTRTTRPWTDWPKQLPQLAKLGINCLILEVNYGFEFQSHPELRHGDRQITKAGAKRFRAKCNDNGIELVPQFQCLGHQSWSKNTGPLLTKYPELDLTPGAFPDNKGIYCREWDPDESQDE